MPLQAARTANVEEDAAVKCHHPDVRRCSPCRPLAWRWERALRLVEDRRYFCPWRDDEWTGAAVRYLRDLRRLPGGRGLDRLARRHPDVHAARQLHEHGGRSALEVRGRLLARQGFGEIERATGL